MKRVSPVELSVLGGILLLAAAIRLWGGFFGLPHVYHPDEGFEIYRALRLGSGSFDFERIGKGGYYFLLLAEYGFYFLWLLVTGVVNGVSEFAEYFVSDPSGFWKIGRVTTALLGTATVGLIWWQGRRMAGARAGLLGAAFLAFSFRHVVDSHYVTVDVPMALFAFASVLLVVEDVEGRQRLRGWLWALLAAYAALNKIPAMLVFAPYVVGAWMRGGFRGKRGLFTTATLGPGLLAILIFCVANPGVVLSFGSFTHMVWEILFAPEVAESVDPAESARAVAEYAGVQQGQNLWIWYLRMLLKSQGPALLLLSFAGAILGIVRRDRAVLLHLSFVVPMYVVIAGAASSHLYYFRYIVPLLPALCLFAGWALDALVRRTVASPGSGAIAAAVISVVLLIEPGIASVQWDRRSAREDTRTQAVHWIEENLEHRTRILLEGFPEEAAQLSIPLRNTKKNIKEMIARLEDTDPGKALFWEMKLEFQPKPMYDLVTVRHFEPWRDLDGYIADGIQYIVVRREFFVRGERPADKFDAVTVESRYAFYADLISSEDATRVAFFEATEDGAPGFDIEIWRIDVPRPETADLAGADSGDGG